MADDAKDDLSVGEVYINSSSLSENQIKALDQLLQFQCFRLEKKLNSLQLKRKHLSEGKDVHVSLAELISREIIEAAEFLSNSPEYSLKQDEFGLNKDEITRIIDNINLRESSESKHVQFVESEEDESPNTSNEPSNEKEVFVRKNKRSSTLPNPNDKMNLSGEVQLILHNKGTCKPCAFVYNKKKTCRNGPSCGFCHHEDHALCTVKRWKKQQKLVSSGSLTSEAIQQIRRSNSEAG
ncbi:hypothetical protein MACJ_001858 [Theileria orientalis]|uniref:C3H1-type domain-containing protein n=1 Tax=Theileria orientalis TaxID=68886 RepID=A0A976QS76_THEOR|nr:hypothetical protein MACJ_001858 [Theileria orientalis]